MMRNHGPHPPAGTKLPVDPEERLRLILRNITDYAIFTLDPAGVVTDWTEGAERVKGYQAAEVVGRHVSVFFTPEQVAAGLVEQELREAAATGRAEREDWRVRKGGERFWANEIATAMRDAGGNLLGFTKITRDLSDRKRAEEAVREGEERYRLLVENIRDHAVHTLDPDGRITSWNPGGERVFGYAADEIVGRHGSVLFTPEDRARDEFARELSAAAADGQASNDRWQVRKDGSRFWANGVTSAIRDAAGAVRGFAKVCRDQTGAKWLEEQREELLAEEQAARREAERTAVLKDEFLAVVSHELRTPLTSILIWAKLLEGGAVPAADLPGVAATIRQGAEAQRQVIDDLLDVSRMASGQLRLDVREADLVPVVRAALDAVRPAAEAKGVAVEASLDERAGRVRVDPDRIRQVVWNLVNNAVKFTDRGGRVSVALGREDSVLRLVVADTGRGISPDFLPHVFERFRQADASTTRAFGGLGLGLAITRQLVELHGGTVRAASPGEGGGATFTVELPLPDVRVAPRVDGRPAGGRGAGPADAWVPSPVLNGVRVLLVEDDANTRTAVRWLLEQCGAAVAAVESAARGLAAIREVGPHDVLVADIGLPGQDGYELMRAIREAERQRGEAGGTPAVALTAYARPADRERALAAGYQNHVSKPVEPAALVAAVAALAGRGGGSA